MENNKEDNRAKQFMSFDALKGLREALEEKEKIEESKFSQEEHIKSKI